MKPSIAFLSAIAFLLSLGQCDCGHLDHNRWLAGVFGHEDGGCHRHAAECDTAFDHAGHDAHPDGQHGHERPGPDCLKTADIDCLITLTSVEPAHSMTAAAPVDRSMVSVIRAPRAGRSCFAHDEVRHRQPPPAWALPVFRC
jgi:hypothetical protein